jgi:List-Bact-rpt repeat protein
MFSPVGGSPSARFRSTWVALAAIAAVAVLLPAPGLLGPSHSASASVSAPRDTGPVSAIGVPAAPHPSVVRPAGSPTTTGTFFANTSAFSLPTVAHEYCGKYFSESYCHQESQSPSLLNLSNGKLGITYSQTTRLNSTVCTYPSTNASGGSITVDVWTEIRVLFSASSNGGGSFGAPTYINQSCPYAQQLEPSFTMAPNGVVDGAFVEANATGAAFNYEPYEPLGYYYLPRYTDALAFVNSTNSGASFSNTTALVLGNVSRPAIATFGDTVYIVYENLSAGATALINGFPTSQYPVSINLVYSTDQGTTWHGPYTLPGENASSFNTSYSPSITVTSSGLVAVAYDTNRSCVFMCGGGYTTYGDDVVVATSSTNGTTWSGPYTVQPAVAESTVFGSNQNTGVYRPYLFEYAPDTSIAYDPASGRLYAAWDGAYFSNASYFYYQYSQTVVWAGVSSTAGVGWTTERVSGPEALGAEQYEGGYFTPALAVADGTAYLTYTFYNDTSGCGYSSYLQYSYSQWLTTSLDGLTWTPPGALEVQPNIYAGDDFLGYTASIGFNATGRLAVAYATVGPTDYLFPNILTTNAVEVAGVWTGATIALEVHETGLAPGTSWSFSVGPAVFTISTNNTTITNVPAGLPELLEWTGAVTWLGYEEYLGVTDAETMAVFSTSSNYTFQFLPFAGLTLSVQPPDISNFQYDLSNGTGFGYSPGAFFFDAYWDTYYGPPLQTQMGGCPFPWYLPLHTQFDLSNVSTFPINGQYTSSESINYWSGTGTGSFTGTGASANVTMGAPINETAWALPIGSYDVPFYALDLPATSVYNLSFNGVSYSSPSTASVTAYNVTTGPHWVTGITANSTRAGWDYLGRSDSGDPLVVPDQPSDFLSFAYVNVSAPPGVVSFHASGFTRGTVWQFAFNGTVYSSATPWINITTRPGTFTESAYPVTSENSSVGYAPTGVAATINVTTGATYPVNYTPTYELQVYTGVGGRVAPGNVSYWLAPGATKTFVATASSGYTFGGWTGSGAGAYTGPNATAVVTVNGPVVETAAFVPLPGARFNLTIQEIGVPNGTSWSAYVGGVGHTSSFWQFNVSSVYSCAVSGARGDYGLAVLYAYANGSSASLTRYVPVAPPATVCGGTTTTLTFSTQYYLTLQTTAGGTATAVYGSTVVTNGSWVATSALVSLSATPSPGYLFLGWNGTGPGNYTGPQSQPQVQLAGPVSELAAFAPIVTPPPPRYTWSLQATPAFPAGTAWAIQFNGTNYSSSTATVTVTGLLAGNYPLTVAVVGSADGMTQWRPTTPSQHITVSANGSTQVTFQPYYWFAISAVGPGSVTPSAGGWYLSGSTITLLAAPQLPSLFAGWTGTGAGSYTGTLNRTSIQITGPVTEVATFVPPVPAVKTVSSTFNSVSTLVVLAVVGLIVGVVVGLIAARMRGGGRSGGDATLPPDAASSAGPTPSPPPVAAPNEWSEGPPGEPAPTEADPSLEGGPA